MRITLAAAGIAALALGVAACSGGDGSPSGNPNAPSPPPPGAVVIDVVRDNGAQSFSPNPATVPAGQMVVWHNVDTITHRVVLDAGGIDTGDLAAGAFSAPMSLGASGGYHCTIHPTMVGTVTR